MKYLLLCLVFLFTALYVNHRQNARQYDRTMAWLETINENSIAEYGYPMFTFIEP